MESLISLVDEGFPKRLLSNKEICCYICTGRGETTLSRYVEIKLPRNYAFEKANNSPDSNWSTMYHGSSKENIISILRHG